LIESGPIESRVGASLTPLTETSKVREMLEFCDWPSLTVTVIVADPLAFKTGVKLREPEELPAV
jgi:hypothetical protein